MVVNGNIIKMCDSSENDLPLIFWAILGKIIIAISIKKWFYRSLPRIRLITECNLIILALSRIFDNHNKKLFIAFMHRNK